MVVSEEVDKIVETFLEGLFSSKAHIFLPGVPDMDGRDTERGAGETNVLTTESLHSTQQDHFKAPEVPVPLPQ